MVRTRAVSDHPTATAAIKRQPALSGTIQRMPAFVAPSPALALRQRLGNRGTQEFVRERVLRSACGGGSAGGCVKPTSVAYLKIDNTWFPPEGYLTGGGICALMQIEPKGRSGYCPVSEEVTRDDKSSCPATILENGGCRGSSRAFPIGAAKGDCAVLKPGKDQFTDLHAVKIRTSVLHDKGRNPKGLSKCTNVCNQVYYTVDDAGKRTDLDRYVITYELTAVSGKPPATNVVTKKAHA